MNMLALGHKGVNKLALICTLLYCIDTPLYYIEPYHSREAYATMNLSSQAKDTNGNMAYMVSQHYCQGLLN